MSDAGSMVFICHYEAIRGHSALSEGLSLAEDHCVGLCAHVICLLLLSIQFQKAFQSHLLGSSVIATLLTVAHGRAKTPSSRKM
jgi:hypothetical protein